MHICSHSSTYINQSCPKYHGSRWKEQVHGNNIPSLQFIWIRRSTHYYVCCECILCLHFRFQARNKLGYREVLLVSFGPAVLALACVLSNLDMQMDPKTMDYQAFTEILPLILVVLVFIILFLPFNILY